MSQEIKSLINATTLLKLFTIDRPYLRVTDLAELSGLSKGAVSKIMRTLASQGIVKPVAKKGYTLGLTLINFAGVALTSNNIQESISPILNKITFKLNLDSHVAILDRFDTVYLQKESGSSHTKIKTSLGGRNPAHCTSSGKVLIAYESQHYRESLINNGLNTFTERTIVNPLQLEKELAQIRQKEVAISIDELTPGVSSVAVPIRDYTNQVIASLTIVGASTRFTKSKLQEYIPFLQQAGRDASEELGYYH